MLSHDYTKIFRKVWSNKKSKEMDKMIPKTIWQTYETTLEDLPDKAKASVETWKDLNPDWTHGYMSGQDREDFFRTEFGGDVFDTYMKLPLGVMKAGLWRFGILYINGGVYADLDTECMVSIDNWLDPQYDMIVDLEGDTPWYATQVIAAKKGHKFLEDAINMAVDRARDGIDVQPHMVHYYTDVTMFTDSLFKSMEIENGYDGDLRQRTLEFNDLPIAKEHKFFSFGGDDARRLLDRDVRHLYWGDGRIENYVAWKDDPLVQKSRKMKK
jgi:hypothetical protein